jgi:hypothetical protein
MVNAQVSRRGWKVRKAELEEGKKMEKEEKGWSRRKRRNMKGAGDLEDVG